MVSVGKEYIVFANGTQITQGLFGLTGRDTYNVVKCQMEPPTIAPTMFPWMSNSNLVIYEDVQFGSDPLQALEKHPPNRRSESSATPSLICSH